MTGRKPAWVYMGYSMRHFEMLKKALLKDFTVSPFFFNYDYWKCLYVSVIFVLKILCGASSCFLSTSLFPLLFFVGCDYYHFTPLLCFSVWANQLLNKKKWLKGSRKALPRGQEKNHVKNTRYSNDSLQALFSPQRSG